MIRKGLSLISERLESLGFILGRRVHKSRNSFELISVQNGGSRKVRIRTLAKRNPVPMGRKLSNYAEDFLIVCRNIKKDPEFYVFNMSEAIEHTTRKLKNGEESYWLEPPDLIKFRDNWGIL